MANEFTLPQDKKLAQSVLEGKNQIDKIRAEQGWLGKTWGSSSSVPHNIAALIALLLVVFVLIYSFCAMSSKPETLSLSLKDLWSIITPLITLSVGYLFGERKKE